MENRRYPVRLILEHDALTMQEKTLLLAVVAVYSFDSEDRCVFTTAHLQKAAYHVGIGQRSAFAVLDRLRDLNVLLDVHDPYAQTRRLVSINVPALAALRKAGEE